MIFTETTTYQLNEGQQDLPGFDSKYLNIVDYILKITEEIWEQRAVWVIYDTYADDIPVHVGAGTIYGIDEIVKGTLKTLSSFPDRKMGGEAVIWSQIDDLTFYSSHRIGSTATNLGDTAFGKATGKKLFFRTIADCVVAENKIIEEWLVRDNLHLVQQLGFDPIAMARLDKRYKGLQPNFMKNGAVRKEFNTRPITPNQATDLIISLFENTWKKKHFANLDRYYDASATLHAICENDLTGPKAIETYLNQFLECFGNIDFHLERVSSNEKEGTYEVAARWKVLATHAHKGFFGPATGKDVSMLGISHFVIQDGKIIEEWTVFDGFDVLCQVYAQ